eukprot:TRINITY_DN7696_c0_g1_i1.p1 TRINITY_DN7696_c0_g1~~TRINITY_DN7696_c0_g1_i1.p1  ORF type:complete len:288 (-),score=40.37 TRINITY_DN7696_c0_g1_i1:60-923(-)
MASSPCLKESAEVMTGGCDETQQSAPEGMLLLKVPKWLSDAWLEAPHEAVVADLDIEGATLRLLPEGGCGADRPQVLTMTSRPSPELFAFKQEGDSESLRIQGAITEALHVKVGLQDTAYKSMLQKRADDHSISSGKRVIHEQERSSLYTPEVSRLVVSSDIEAQIFSGEPARPLEVAVAVKRCLRASGHNGITCAELLERLPKGSTFTAVRDALVAMADCRVSGPTSERRYFLTMAAMRRSRLPDAGDGGVASTLAIGDGGVGGLGQGGSRLKRPRTEALAAGGRR